MCKKVFIFAPKCEEQPFFKMMKMRLKHSSSLAMAFDHCWMNRKVAHMHHDGTYGADISFQVTTHK